jgi:hypothetical protein
MPIVKKEGCEHAPALSDKVRAKFRKLIFHSIGLLLVSGVVMFWLLLRQETSSLEAAVPGLGNLSAKVSGVSEWENLSAANHHLLEAKILLALILFGISLYLVIPTQPDENLRQKAPKLMLINLALGMIILLLAALRHVVH